VARPRTVLTTDGDVWNDKEVSAAAAPLLDGFGRVATDLRVSLIDRCNFRCTYCMPAEGLPWLARDDVLRAEEIERLARLLVRLGVREIKLTGGEPTVRPDLAILVARLRAIDPEIDLSLTTNGYLLDRLAGPLAEAGLNRVTISCDSLLRHRFAEMTRRDALDRVLAGVDAARAADLTPIKVNCVVIGGTNDCEAVAFAELARRTGAEVRFIEFMPLDADERWSGDRVVPSATLRRRIEAVFPLRPANGHAPQPAQVYRFADGVPGSVGFVSSVTEPFCDTCNRIRITADGQLRSCLFATEETDLREPMRSGADDGDLERLIRVAVAGKWAGHRIGRPDFVRPGRSMSMIGG
jgi:GTP 3',8-cyclase